MCQASRRVFVVGAFSSHFTEEPMKLHSLAQLHRYRGRRSGAMPFGRESWCLVSDSKLSGTRPRLEVQLQKALPTIDSATEAVSIPTDRIDISGGVQGTREGSIPSSTTEYLNNDRV